MGLDKTDDPQSVNKSHKRQIDSLRATISEVLRPLLPQRAPVALVDFPRYSNVGDSAIWLGVKRWLTINQNTRTYVCEPESYDTSILQQRHPSGPILLQGGGNFGDLWPRHQILRERVIADFPDRQIVQLPQSLHFNDPVALKKTADILNSHPNLTLLFRDQKSLAIANQAFKAQTVLCPDMAFCLTLRRSGRATYDHVVVKRSDQEMAQFRPQAAGPHELVTDWLEDGWFEHIAAGAYTRATIRYPSRIARWQPMLADRLAELRLRRGVRLLSSGKRVTTDRLHVHILCVLLGIPHRVFDNSYGKLSSFISAWTAGCCDAAF
jgi:exopolysaccharide biosynthesis predicted pyruvyltransferase EpsI